MRFHVWIAYALSGAALLGQVGKAIADETAAIPEAEAFRPIKPAEAKPLFGRIAGLEGKWRGKSTKGWTDEVTIDVIARRSAVLFDSFGAHQDERMLTLFNLDGDSLMLTHHCVARNQPTLRAERISRDGDTIWFRFVEGGNMTSRDVGHMDALKLTFEPEGGFTSQWTWYQKGEERWMERILHKPIAAQSHPAHPDAG